MEYKLAEFRRQKAEDERLKRKTNYWKNFRDFLLSTFKEKFQLKNEKVNDNHEHDEIESKINWLFLSLKFLIWFCLLFIFIRLEFGIIFLILSLFYLIWTNLENHSRNSDHNLSAYSVFNRNFEKLPGTFSGEDYDQQMRRGGGTF